jgi:hypothetical protein
MFIDTNQAYFAKMASFGGRTNLFYLPKYFKKGEGERKAEQKRGEKDNLTRHVQLFYG